MLMSRDVRQAGDTIVEVLFAVAVFSLVAVGALSIMNQGVAMAQRSLETTLARQQMDAQAEALRYIQNAYVASQDGGSSGGATRWSEIQGRVVESPSAFGEAGLNAGRCVNPSAISNAFAINTSNLSILTGTRLRGANTYPLLRRNALGVVTRAEGIWIEAVSTPANRDKFIDFHIRTCWDSPGSSAPVTLGTIVRLYVPG